MSGETFTYKTRAEQRLEWLKTRKRPLTEEEAEELYRALHAIYQRDWRRYQQRLIEREVSGATRIKRKSENTKLLKQVMAEAVQK